MRCGYCKKLLQTKGIIMNQGSDYYFEEGMSIRTYIATHVLQGILSKNRGFAYSTTEAVSAALEYTDELIAKLNGSESCDCVPTNI